MQWRAQNFKFGYSKIQDARKNGCFIPIINIYTFGYSFKYYRLSKLMGIHEYHCIPSGPAPAYMTYVGGVRRPASPCAVWELNLVAPCLQILSYILFVSLTMIYRPQIYHLWSISLMSCIAHPTLPHPRMFIYVFFNASLTSLGFWPTESKMNCWCEACPFWLVLTCSPTICASIFLD